MNQQLKKENLRQEILRKSTKVLAEEYENFSIEYICKNYNVSKGSMYRFTRSKDDLFLKITNAIFKDLAEYIKENFDFTYRPTILIDYHKIRVEYFKSHPLEYNAFLTITSKTPSYLIPNVKEAKKDLELINYEIYQIYIENLDIREGLTKEQALKYFKAIDDVFWQLANAYDKENDRLKVASELLNLILYGIKKN